MRSSIYSFSKESLGVDDGEAQLQVEGHSLLRLMASPQSAALRHVFFAQRGVGKIEALASPDEILYSSQMAEDDMVWT